MKLTKKLLLASLGACMTMGLAFGQPASKTSVSTKGMFDTDVDNFMSVTGWSSVNPSNAFIMADATGFGFAKQFKPFYLGLFLGGKFDKIESSTSKVSGTTSEKISETTYIFNKYTLEALFGFGNMAVSAYFKPVTGTSKSSSSTSGTVNTENKDKDFEFSTGLEFGMNTNLLGKAFDQSFIFDISSDVDYDYSSGSSGGTSGTIENEASEYKITLGSVSSWELYSAKGLKNTVGLEAATDFAIIPDAKDSNSSSTSKGSYEFNLGLIPSWTTKYEVEGFKFGVKAQAPMSLTASGSANTVTSGGNVSYPTRTLESNFEILPKISAGVQLKLAKPVVLNAGTSLDLPNLLWSTTKNLTRDATNGNVENTIKTSAFEFNSNNAATSLTFTSGFAVTVAKNVVVDMSYNIVSQFNNFAWAPAGTDIWETLNGLLFTNLDLGVSIKL